MKRVRLFLAVAIAIGMTWMTGTAIARHPDKPLTVAVFGDWPYSTTLLNDAPLLLNSVNADPDVRVIIHVGDIHSGSMPCTGAGLDPVPAGADPAWNQGIFQIFQQFNDPLVYTPGDNEWTDCHKTKEFSSGAPLNELAAVRSLFFTNPGLTLGGKTMEVKSQAGEDEDDDSTDAQFVENVMWTQSQVVFVTLNVPGSNNDGLPWSGGTGSPFLNEPARLQEAAERNAANLHWLGRAFHTARERKARAVVIAIQADMWDLSALQPGGDGLNGYDAFVQALAKHAAAFKRPVLLLNGDSHVYHTDRPLDPTDRTDCVDATGITGCTGGAVLSPIHSTQAVPNLTRITVQGSTNHPSEWLKLTIDPDLPTVFSWQNVVYLP